MESSLSALFTVLLAALAGVGFSLIVETSPLGRIPHKPFACRVCRSGWGAILASASLLAPGGLFTAWPWHDPTAYMTWALVSFAGIGLAHLVFGLADRGTTSAPPLPDFDEK